MKKANKVRGSYKSYWSRDEIGGKGQGNWVRTYIHMNYNYPMHSHGFFEINFVMRGSGTHILGDRSVPTAAGDVFVIPPETEHCYLQSERMDVYHILLRDEFMSRYREELEALSGFNALFHIEPFIRSEATKSERLTLSIEEMRGLKRRLERAAKAEAAGDFAYGNIITLETIAHLCSLYSERKKTYEPHSKTVSDAVLLMEYIDENLDKSLTLDTLCEIVNMSRASLNRLFRAMLGTTPKEYVLSKRVERARELVALGGMTKCEIAQACGFYDSAHLNKNLKGDKQ